MKRRIRVALLASVSLTLGIDPALAQMAAAPPAPDLYGPGPMRGRLADRVMRDFDLNKDGTIAQAELDQALADRFSKLSGGGGSLTEAQFSQAHEAMLQDHTGGQFRRIDWNGDGMLSLAEFRAPLRARFEKMDRDASGTISCAARREGRKHHGAKPGGAAEMQVKGHRRLHRRSGRQVGGGLAKMCHEADFNKDGRLTRAEFDRAVTEDFSAAAKGGQGMTPAEFYGIQLGRFHEMEGRRFKRLDKNHDGKLSEAEFSAPGKKLFARLDRNQDGVLTKDELSRSHRRKHRDRHPGSSKKLD